MPLVQSASKQSVGTNISREQSAGKPFRQALAIALSVQRRNKRAAGGVAPITQAPSAAPLQTAAPAINSSGYVTSPNANFGLDLNTGAMTPLSNNINQGFAERGLPITNTPGGQANGQVYTPPPAAPASASSAVDPAAALAAALSSIPNTGPWNGNRRGGAIHRAGGGMMPSMSEMMPPWTRSEAHSMEHPAGLIQGPTGGRADAVPMSLAPHSHVIPADVVGGFGGGNTSAGALNLQHALSTGPFGTALPKVPSRPPKALTPSMPKLARGGMAHGGVKTLVSHGEMIIPPADVQRIGGGDYDKGHDWLDRMIVDSRKQIIAQMRKLPSPVKE